MRRRASSPISPRIQIGDALALGIDKAQLQRRGSQRLLALGNVLAGGDEIGAAVFVAAPQRRNGVRLRRAAPSSASSRASAASMLLTRAATSLALGVIRLALAVRLQTQQPDQRREGQALADQRHQDHREGDQQQQVAVGKGRAARHTAGSDSAAASDTTPRMPVKADQENLTPGRRRSAFAGAAAATARP